MRQARQALCSLYTAVYCNTMPNSGLNVVNGGGSARGGAKDVSNGAESAATEPIVSPQNQNDTTLCNTNTNNAYYTYQKQVYQRQILLQQQQQQQQLKLCQEEKHLRREVDLDGERQEIELRDKIQASLHSQHVVRDRVNKGYSPPYRKQTSDNNSFDNISDDTVVKEAVESADNQQKPAFQKMDTSYAQNNDKNNNHIPEPCHVPKEPSSNPVSQKKRKRRTASSAGMVVHIPTSQQKKPKTSQPYHIPTPSPMYQNGLSPHPGMMQQQFGQINPYDYGHLGVQSMSMPPHGMAPPPPAQHYNPPPPPYPGFIPNHGNTYPMNHPYYHHSVTPQFAHQPQFRGLGGVAEVRDETTESMTCGTDTENGEERSSSRVEQRT